MPNTLEAEEYCRLFLEDIPMIDLRAPIEFTQGAFATSTSLPLMSDKEREAVGTRYKEEGQDAAIILGHELVSGELKAERIAAWKAFIEQNPHGVLYCFRGGLRSRTTQQWIIDECGIDYPRVEGGYKALRRFLIDETERLISKFNIIVLSGQSGTGKTRILQKIPHSLDLEGLANHRGSAFGNTTTPQPTQINFENDVAIALLKAEAAGYKTLVVEDESRNIGSLHLPTSLHAKMTTSAMVMLDVPDENRIEITIQEYAKDIHLDYSAQFGEALGLEKLSDHLLGSLAKLQKRLGGERYKRMQQMMNEAIALLSKSGDYSGFADIFGELLIDYYDPMYSYQLSKKVERVTFTGSRDAVLEYLLDESKLQA